MWLRVAGLCGVFSPIIALSLLSLAIAQSPWFSWRINALSDLGVSNVAKIFNSNLILTGFLSIIFAAGFIESVRKRWLGLVGTFLLISSYISLIAIGVFPESAGRIHPYVSVAFFALEPMAFFLIGATLIKSSEYVTGLLTILLAASAVGIWVFWFQGPPPHIGIAKPELASSITFSIWSIVFGIRLFKQSNAS